jgi:hypothetical protein
MKDKLMDDSLLTSHRVAIAGWVLDGATRKPIAGASVAITEMPAALEQRLAVARSAYVNWDQMTERPDKRRTRKDGLFYFLDLPEGGYTVTAVLPKPDGRHGVGQVECQVTRNEKGKPKVAFVTLTVPATSVNGKIVGSGHKNGIAMAQVRVKGSGERAFTDAQGQYAVNGLEAGNRVLTVSAQGYQPASESVILSKPGASKTINFSLTRENG